MSVLLSSEVIDDLMLNGKNSPFPVLPNTMYLGDRHYLKFETSINSENSAPTTDLD